MISVRRASPAYALAYRAAGVLAGSLLMALSAKLAINIGPVPITGQTLALPIVVALFGTNLGTLSIVLYLAEGALGLPVFAGGSGGITPFLGPTAGYLWAFPPAAFAIGLLFDAGLGRTLIGRIAAIFVGTSLVIVSGTAWLTLLTGNMSLAFKAGFVPFIIGDLLKVVIAASVVPQWTTIKTRLGI